jgi:endoglucanase
MKKVLIFVLALTINMSALSAQTAIRLNQVGFYPRCVKQAAIIGATSGVFYVISTNLKDTVFRGTLGAANLWAASNESVQLADFTSFGISGDYVLAVPGLGQSYPFKINSKVHLNVTKGALKAYYYQRASTAITAANGGVYARPAGHPDNQVVVLPSAASPGRPAGTIISTPKGWYDAGDYNKYIVNSGISTYTVLAAYEQFPSFYDTLNVNIPESNNGIPDILDETLWNLRWMLTMQDPYDGGVYNKTTNAKFDAFIMPDKATTTRYVVAKGTAATLDFAAVMAQASRIFKPYSQLLPGFSDSCLAASKFAWSWGRKNPNMAFNNPAASGIYPAVTTGGYGDTQLADEMEWAANELYITTKADSFYTAGKVSTAGYGIPGWSNVRTLGLLSLAQNKKNLTPIADTTLIKNKLIGIVTPYRDYQVANSPYGITMGMGGNADFYWGSNSNAGNQAILLMAAYRINKDISYWNAALSNIDYLLGRNATGYCWLTGFGSYSTMNPHHRVSSADGIANPVPGLLAGGPQNSATGDGCATVPYTAASYNDVTGCYTTNEVTINWNAPFVYLSAGIETINPGATELKATITTPNGATDFCVGGSIVLTANSGQNFAYQWKKDGSAIQGATAATYTANTAGNYSVQITSGIYTSLSPVSTIRVSNPPTTSNAGPDQITTSSSTNMSGNTPTVGTGTWSVVNGTGKFNNPNSGNAYVTGLTAGLNKFRWTISNGSCLISFSDVSITYNIPTTSVGQVNLYDVHPNPFTDGVSIRIYNPGFVKMTLQITDIRGAVVYLSNNHLTNDQIYISNLAIGMYMVRATFEDKVSQFKIVRHE